MNRRIITGISIGMISTIIWGSFYPVSRMLFGHYDETLEPLNFTLIRFILAALSLSPILFFKGNSRKFVDMLRHDWLQLFLLGSIGTVGEGLLIFWSMGFTTAARASLMANTSPIWTLLISFFVTHEALTKSKLTGMTIGAIGVFLAFIGKGNDVFTGGASTLIGDFMALASGICWAVFTVFGQKFANRYGGLLCCEALLIDAVIIMLPIALLRNGGIMLNFSWQAWAGAIYLGILSYGIADVFWYVALKYVTPGQLGSLGYVSAMLALVVSMILLDEKITLLFVCAICCILGGVALMLKSPKKP
ncbi:MAG: DMT family transporter [Victivallales bacterium]|nr:DMT family transporter [Victivallales bacterium]